MGAVHQTGEATDVQPTSQVVTAGAISGARNTTKHRGDFAEMQFMMEASKRGFAVAKPFGDKERYDVVLDAGQGRLWRVQVKSSRARHHRSFAVRSSWRTSGK